MVDLLRRAFGIPDIVQTDNQAAAVAHALIPGIKVDSIDEETDLYVQVAQVGAVVTKIAEMGATGELDALFFIKLGDDFPNVIDFRRVVAEPFQGIAKTKDLHAIIETAFEKVTSYVAAHPVDPL